MAKRKCKKLTFPLAANDCEGHEPGTRCVRFHDGAELGIIEWWDECGWYFDTSYATADDMLTVGLLRQVVEKMEQLEAEGKPEENSLIFMPVAEESAGYSKQALDVKLPNGYPLGVLDVRPHLKGDWYFEPNVEPLEPYLFTASVLQGIAAKLVQLTEAGGAEK